MTATLDLTPRPASVQSVELRPGLEAHEPPEARGRGRDDVRLMVSRTAAGEVSHHAFTDLPDLLLPGDLLVVNNSATLPAAVELPDTDLARRDELAGPAGRVGTNAAPGPQTVHFSTAMPDGSWLVELRSGRAQTTAPYPAGHPGQRLGLPGRAVLTLAERFSQRLWHATLSTAAIPYLRQHGRPIRYSYVPASWPLSAYQTVFATVPGSAEMPSAARPFTAEIVTRLVSRGIAVAPVTLHTGVSSLEGGEDPYPESFDVPPATARLVSLTRRNGGRIIAAGTTVVRALETAARDGCVSASWASAGWTSHVVTPQTGVAWVDGLLTGLHEPRSTHLWMLAAFAGHDLLSQCYAAAADLGYRWHEFGDVHLLLP